MPQYACAEAVDGMLATRWASAQMIDPQFIDFDFSAPVHISEVQILW
jgi:hypothetical protein